MKTYILRDPQSVQPLKVQGLEPPDPPTEAVVEHIVRAGQRAPALYIGLDVHTDSIAVSLAPSDSNEVRRYGLIGGTHDDGLRLAKKLQAAHPGVTLQFVYEAGPHGYPLCRCLRAHHYDCIITPPSKIPRKPGERVKTNRRDADQLARLHRAGELTAIHVPEPEDEDQAQRPPPETPGRLQQSLTNHLNRSTARRGGGSLQRSGRLCHAIKTDKPRRARRKSAPVFREANPMKCCRARKGDRSESDRATGFRRNTPSVLAAQRRPTRLVLDESAKNPPPASQSGWATVFSYGTRSRRTIKFSDRRRKRPVGCKFVCCRKRVGVAIGAAATQNKHRKAKRANAEYLRPTEVRKLHVCRCAAEQFD